MTRYKVLRELYGCDPFTSWFISTLNWCMSVPSGTIKFMNVDIEYADHE